VVNSLAAHVTGPRTCRENSVRLTAQWRELAALVVALLDRAWPDGAPTHVCCDDGCPAARLVAAAMLRRLGHDELVSAARFVMVENAVRRWMSGEPTA